MLSLVVTTNSVWTQLAAIQHPRQLQQRQRRPVEQAAVELAAAARVSLQIIAIL